MTPEPRTPIRPRLTLVSAVFPVLASLALAAPGAAQSLPDQQPQGLPGIMSTCIPNAETLCLNNSRFAVTAVYQLTPSGPSFQATAVPLTADSGYFWFFNEANVEIVVKVLNGCFDPFQSYWVFAAGLTNVGAQMAVTDTLIGQTVVYDNPIGRPFPPIQDTKAFSTCP